MAVRAFEQDQRAVLQLTSLGGRADVQISREISRPGYKILPVATGKQSPAYEVLAIKLVRGLIERSNTQELCSSRSEENASLRASNIFERLVRGSGEARELSPSPLEGNASAEIPGRFAGQMNDNQAPLIQQQEDPHHGIQLILQQKLARLHQEIVDAVANPQGHRTPGEILIEIDETQALMERTIISQQRFLGSCQGFHQALSNANEATRRCEEGLSREREFYERTSRTQINAITGAGIGAGSGFSASLAFNANPLVTGISIITSTVAGAFIGSKI